MILLTLDDSWTYCSHLLSIGFYSAFEPTELKLVHELLNFTHISLVLRASQDCDVGVHCCIRNKKPFLVHC